MHEMNTRIQNQNKWDQNANELLFTHNVNQTCSSNVFSGIYCLWLWKYNHSLIFSLTTTTKYIFKSVPSLLSQLENRFSPGMFCLQIADVICISFAPPIRMQNSPCFVKGINRHIGIVSTIALETLMQNAIIKRVLNQYYKSCFYFFYESLCWKTLDTNPEGKRRIISFYRVEALLTLNQSTN